VADDVVLNGSCDGDLGLSFGALQATFGKAFGQAERKLSILKAVLTGTEAVPYGTRTCGSEEVNRARVNKSYIWCAKM
jgi:hypothetical protein